MRVVADLSFHYKKAVLQLSQTFPFLFEPTIALFESSLINHSKVSTSKKKSKAMFVLSICTGKEAAFLGETGGIQNK